MQKGSSSESWHGWAFCVFFIYNDKSILMIFLWGSVSVLISDNTEMYRDEDLHCQQGKRYWTVASHCGKF